MVNGIRMLHKGSKTFLSSSSLRTEFSRPYFVYCLIDLPTAARRAIPPRSTDSVSFYALTI